MEIPFYDMTHQMNREKADIEEAFQSVISGKYFSSGTAVENFEVEFAGFNGTSNFIACANGTDALELIFRALELRKGDEVIVPAYSCWATVEPLLLLGINPVFVDVKPYSLNIDHDLIQSVITPKTKAILAVNLYGNAANLPQLASIAEQNGLILIEDCAQAHGAELKGRALGTFGRAGAFSFYPTKNLGALGEAGGILTGDDELGVKLLMYRDHGQSGKDRHLFPGRNSRMDELQGAILLKRLEYLEKWNEARREIATQYQRFLKGSVRLIEFHAGAIYHQFPIFHDQRDELRNFLKDQGIGTGIHYPYTLPGTAIGDSSGFPIAREASETIISLPIYPGLSQQQVEYISGCVLSF